MCVHVLHVIIKVFNLTNPKMGTCLSGDTIDWDHVPTVRLL